MDIGYSIKYMVILMVGVQIFSSEHFYLVYYYVDVATASMVEGLESMTSNPVTSLARVRSLGDALVV
jgi:hypothetical protein